MATNPGLRRRVLVCAYAVSPVRGSEPGIGWNVVSRLARRHDVTVLAAPSVPGSNENNFRQDCERYAAEHGPVPGLTLQWIDPPLLSRLLQRESLLLRRTLYYTGYAAWQRAALAVARRLHAQQPFDLVHHLNITGFREPGYLWTLDAPFVWGPIAGAPELPPAYFDLLSWKERLFYRLRNWTNGRQKRSKRCLAAARAARHIWAVSPEDQALARERWGRDAEHLRESAAAPRSDGYICTYDGRRPLRLVWSGQHIGRKALPILLHALRQLQQMGDRQPRVELTILGDGPERPHWERLAERLQLRNIAWRGWVERERAIAEVSRADVLISTSLLEGTPQVLLEAMALGLPVVCHNTCGMAAAITDDCGIRIPLTDSAGSIRAYAQAVQRLASDPGEVRRLSAGALQRVVELSWDKQSERMLAVYEEVLGSGVRRRSPV
jgi:glycosyltransferase involved in cell wall biosynthesis